jgi:hypothetical protein
VSRRTAIAAGAAALLLAASAACSGSTADNGTARADPTIATEPPRTTTTHPYAVPAVIDVAYVDRVLAGLDEIMADVVRIVISTRTIPRDAYDRIRAVYGDDDWLQGSIDSLQKDIRGQLSTYRLQPGPTITRVTALLSVQPGCIFAEVSRDYSAVSAAPSPPEKQWVALAPLSPHNDPNRHNRTNWSFIYDGFGAGRVAPSNPCAR